MCSQVAGRERNTVTYIGASGESGIVAHEGTRANGTVQLLDSSFRLHCREGGRALWAELNSLDANHHAVLQIPDAGVEEGRKCNPLLINIYHQIQAERWLLLFEI